MFEDRQTFFLVHDPWLPFRASIAHATQDDPGHLEARLAQAVSGKHVAKTYCVQSKLMTETYLTYSIFFSAIDTSSCEEYSAPYGVSKEE
jgi:hypothetical protein